MPLSVASPCSEAEFAAYYELRWRVLRKPFGQGREMARDDLEDAADHAMVRDSSGRLVGVGRIHLVDKKEAQVRFMGVEEGYRGCGVGRALIEYLEEKARQRGAERIALNSRSEVVGFYEKLGYRVVGEGPKFFESIRHVRMEKNLTPP